MNLYVHFPFCRAKCAYCALHSRAGSTPESRRAYCADLAEQLVALGTDSKYSTIYFGGGSPALCDLTPIFNAVRSHGRGATCCDRNGRAALPRGHEENPALLRGRKETVPEFTVELHPLDARPDVLEMLKKGGVNRISMGVQSLDDDVLKAMGRLHTAAEAEAAFRAVRAAGTTAV